jgi:dephospho-CoA kinase
MIRIGLTGSIGMGKSAVSSMFRQMGVPVFDADAEVHRLQGPGGALVDKIEARFPGTTGPKGVDRQKLGAAVLGKPHELRALEHIVHPAVYHARQRFLRQHRARPLVVLDIPLLFEKGGAKQVDVTVVVSAHGFLQRRRVLRRPGMTEAKLFGSYRGPIISNGKKPTILLRRGLRGLKRARQFVVSSLAFARESADSPADA